MKISGTQCRMARAAIKISQGELARRAGVTTPTIVDYEFEHRPPLATTSDAIEAALVNAGVEFVRREDGAEGVVVRTTAAP